MNKHPFWEESYKDRDATVFGQPSKEFYALVDDLPKGAFVLDLGCGDGRNALFLAQHGYRITEVDISQSAIDKLNYLADETGISIDAEVGDIGQFKFKKKYNLIIAHGCWHLIKREQWRTIIPEMKSATEPSEYNVIAAFTDQISPPEDLKDFNLEPGKGKLFYHGNLPFF